MEQEYKLLGFVLFAIFAIVGLGWVLSPVDRMVERQVLVNSHQYIEGMEQRAAILRANIAEVDGMLSTGQGDRDNLLAQKRTLTAQLKAITIQ